MGQHVGGEQTRNSSLLKDLLELRTQSLSFKDNVIVIASGSC